MDNSTQTLVDITEGTIYLMGTCFVLGSLFTIFVLIVLDFMRRDQDKKES